MFTSIKINKILKNSKDKIGDNQDGALLNITSVFSDAIPLWHKIDIQTHCSQGEGLFEFDGRSFVTETETYKNVFLSDIFGLSSSKENLIEFNCLDDIANSGKCDEYLGELSLKDLDKNLKWEGIRIMHDMNSYEFIQFFSYFNKFFYMNTDGSHHFISARYIANKLNVDVVLSDKVTVVKIDEDLIVELKQKYDLIFIGT